MKKVTAFLALSFLAIASRAASHDLVDLGTLGGTESFAGTICNNGLLVVRGRLLGDAATRDSIYRNDHILEMTPLNSGDITSASFPKVNNRGLVAGGTMVGAAYYPAVYDLKSGQTTILGSLGAVTGGTGAALGINNHGQVVGYSYLNDYSRHAFLWSNGRLTDLGSFGGYSCALAINDVGTIVGFSAWDPFGSAVAFVHKGGVMQPIDPFAGGESYAEDVNERDEVVGTGLTADHSAFRGFLWQRGVTVDMGTLPGGRQSDAMAINNVGNAVGIADVPVRVETFLNPDTGQLYTNTIYGWKGFLYERGQMVELNRLVDRPEWDLTWAWDINDRGEIVGYGVLDGKFRAYLLTPKHEKKVAGLTRH